MPVLTNVEFASINETNIDAVPLDNVPVNSTLPISTKEEASASLNQYIKSIIFMPHSLRMVCLTNLFCWMAHVRQ